MVDKVSVPGVARLPAFSHAAVHAGMVYVSGLLGADADSMALVEGGVLGQSRRALDSLVEVLAACGCSLDDVVKVNVYLTDMSTFGVMNDVYVQYFSDPPPARITVGVSALALGAAVELDCVAALPPGSAGVG